ncbi:hypothetical protein [Paraburkholderia aromaticivorans]|uniref:hypothetical protein n=1 Tax=Paraburkholderia aromaticivorans TaxID=2026199 RepID=UPI00145610F4|nr:hypothetical protein [Paraburkholderia aromaticivorans]
MLHPKSSDGWGTRLHAAGLPAFAGSLAPRGAASFVSGSKFMQPESGGIEPICRKIEELRQAPIA